MYHNPLRINLHPDFPRKWDEVADQFSIDPATAYQYRQDIRNQEIHVRDLEEMKAKADDPSDRRKINRVLRKEREELAVRRARLPEDAPPHPYTEKFFIEAVWSKVVRPYIDAHQKVLARFDKEYRDLIQPGLEVQRMTFFYHSMDHTAQLLIKAEFMAQPSYRFAEAWQALPDEERTAERMMEMFIAYWSTVYRKVVEYNSSVFSSDPYRTAIRVLEQEAWRDLTRNLQWAGEEIYNMWLGHLAERWIMEDLP